MRLRLPSSGAILLGVGLTTACATTRESKWKEPEAAPVAAAPAAGAPAAAPEATSEVAQADALWNERGDRQKLSDALMKYELAASTAPSAELFEKLARGHYFLAEQYAVEEAAALRDTEYTKGLDWAERALKIRAPDMVKQLDGGARIKDVAKLAPKEAVPALYWYATNLGKWAGTQGFATVLKYKDDAKAAVEQVKALDETFFYGAPYRYFGTFEARTAGMAGGDLGRSKTNFEKALAIAPNYLATKVLWAENLSTKTRNKEEYKKLLQEVVGANPAADPAIEPENRLEQKKAQKLLAKVDESF